MNVRSKTTKNRKVYKIIIFIFLIKNKYSNNYLDADTSSYEYYKNIDIQNVIDELSQDRIAEDQ